MNRLIALVSFAVFATAAGAADVQLLSSVDPALKMPPVNLQDGRTVNYIVGIGSGAFRHSADPADVIWTVGDRGPNMTCGQAGKLLDKAIGKQCKAVKRGRVYPIPAYVPSIYKVQLNRGAGTFKILQTIALRKAKSGTPISGLLNPQTVATRDTGINITSKVLPYDPDNVDLEAIVRVGYGTFWIGEEMGPSIAHVAADGWILKRLVPADAIDDYKGSEARIVASLPAILSKRQGNRGIESIAISPDEEYLYFILQNPLANPDAKTYARAMNTRLFKLERESGKLVGEFVYQLDNPQTFGFDPSSKQNAPRVSEMIALGLDRLLVLVRTDKTTKLHEISISGATNIFGSKWDDSKNTPTLEQSNDLKSIAVTPVGKILRFDTFRDFKGAPGKLEGLAFLGDGSLAMINDNDFGIGGDETKIIVIRNVVKADKAAYSK